MTRVDPERLHDIAEVDAARLDQDLDFVGFRFPAGSLVEGKMREDARLVDLEAIGRDGAVPVHRIPAARRQILRLHPVNTADMTTISAERHFVFPPG